MSVMISMACIESTPRSRRGTSSVILPGSFSMISAMIPRRSSLSVSWAMRTVPLCVSVGVVAATRSGRQALLHQAHELGHRLDPHELVVGNTDLELPLHAPDDLEHRQRVDAQVRDHGLVR